MNTTAKAFLIINGIILITYGLVFLANPSALGKLVDFTFTGPEALVEVMAVYGGLKIGLGLFLIWCAIEGRRLKMGLIALGFVFLASAIARLIGIYRYNSEDKLQLVIAGGELAFSVFAFCLHTLIPYIQKKRADYLLVVLLNKAAKNVSSYKY